MISRAIYLIIISILLVSCEDDPESLSISTDKSLYEGSESITVTIRNDSTISTYIAHCNEFSFEKQSFEKWNNIYSVDCTKVYSFIEIPGGTVYQDTLDLDLLPTSETISPGMYRISYSLFEKKFVDYFEEFLPLYDLTTEEFEIKLDTIPSGSYRYTGYDSLGIPVVKGWLLFENEDSTQLSGEWSLDSVGAPVKIGPQTGTGTFTGGNDNGTVWIDLNPGMADNNVFLAGTFEINGTDKLLNGKWNYSGFPAVLNQGTFSSIKEK